MLSGDDAVTIPGDRAGRARRNFNVVSNRDPRRDERNLRTACQQEAISPPRGAIQKRYLPLMNVNFVESNPIPVKAAMGLMGLLDPVLPPAAGSPSAGQPGEDRKGAGSYLAFWRKLPLQAEIERLYDEKPAAYSES